MERQGSADEASSERVKVYVRVRPLSKEERERSQEQVRPLTRCQTRSPLLEAWLCRLNMLCAGVVLESDTSEYASPFSLAPPSVGLYHHPERRHPPAQSPEGFPEHEECGEGRGTEHAQVLLLKGQGVTLD